VAGWTLVSMAATLAPAPLAAAPEPQQPPARPQAAERGQAGGRGTGDDLFDKSLKAALEAIKVYGRWDSPADLKRVNDIGYRVAQESGYREYPIAFALIDMPEPNAFALPGGQVFVTRGMLSLGLTDDELAALLGHEIAHVVHHHGTRMERRATLLNVLTQALLVGVLVGGAGRRNQGPAMPDPYGVGPQPAPGSGDLVFGSYAASLVLGELLLRNYSREFEDEADEDGQRWAAAAGFDPDGTLQLMNALGSRLPESKQYGYWRTHPFFTQRVVAAEARGRDLVRGEQKPVAEFRSWSQHRVLDLGASQPTGSDGALLIEAMALAAWPRGAEADRLRLERLHRERSAVLERKPLSRDYGHLLASYDRQIAEVTELDPGSSALATLRTERAALASDCEQLYPQAQAVWKTGIYETAFLETFLSDWPDAAEVPQVALALGEAYGRTARQADAVAMFLRAVATGPKTEAGSQALRGLRNLAPALDQLTALAQLADQTQDPELARLADQRLAVLAPTYDDIAAGAAYLRAHPAGRHAAAVAARLDVLAENLYGEVLLYQSVGDHVRAIDRIQKILTNAPTSPAAQKLLDKSILPS
jgi:Zn-dependent protease with chaperone function/tetratricopeptide (TPR) repeat protein